MDEAATELNLSVLTDQLRSLIQFAQKYGIEIAGPPGWGFLLAHRLAVDHVRDFMPRPMPRPAPKPKLGRPLEKDLNFRMGLSIALAKEEAQRGLRGAKARTAKRSAENQSKLLKTKGRRLSDCDKKKIVRQLQNDLSRLNVTERALGIFIAGRDSQGAIPEQIRAEIAATATSDIFSSLCAVRDIIAGTYTRPHNNSPHD